MGSKELGQGHRGLRSLQSEAPAFQSLLFVLSSARVAETWLLICSENVYCLSVNHIYEQLGCTLPQAGQPEASQAREEWDE